MSVDGQGIDMAKSEHDRWLSYLQQQKKEFDTVLTSFRKFRRALKCWTKKHPDYVTYLKKVDGAYGINELLLEYKQVLLHDDARKGYRHGQTTT
jgi:hypothetical protein